MRTIKVTIRNVYGREMIYPANYTAEVLCNLAGTKTLSLANLRDAKALGLVVEVEGASGALVDQIRSAA